MHPQRASGKGGRGGTEDEEACCQRQKSKRLEHCTIASHLPGFTLTTGWSVCESGLVGMQKYVIFTLYPYLVVNHCAMQQSHK